MIRRFLPFILLLSISAFPQSVSFPGPGLGRGASFVDPTSLPNLKLWLSADCTSFSGSCSSPSDGTNLSTWSDESGNANTATVNSGTCTYHTNQINSKPAVTFSSCKLDLTTAIHTGTWFVVFVRNSGSKETFLSGPTFAENWWTNGDSPAKQQGLDKACNTDYGGGTANANTSWHQANLSNTGGDLTLRLDRAADGTIFGTSGTDPSSIGYNNCNASEFLAGQIAEFISYSDGKNPTDVASVEGYLLAKYGL